MTDRTKPGREPAADDAVIGRAFRWSLVVIAVIAGAGAITAWLDRARTGEPELPPSVSHL